MGLVPKSYVELVRLYVAELRERIVISSRIESQVDSLEHKLL
jgi:hypothetical protein